MDEAAVLPPGAERLRHLPADERGDGGERTLIEVEVAPGGGTPPDYHETYQEGFEVLRGELEVHVGGEMRTLRPGSEGLEKALKAGYGLASDGRNPHYHPYYLAVLLEWGATRLPGVFTVAEPPLRLLAGRARRKGVDRELEARYCR